jgi:hypothetical protein
MERIHLGQVDHATREKIKKKPFLSLRQLNLKRAALKLISARRPSERNTRTTRKRWVEIFRPYVLYSCNFLED